MKKLLAVLAVCVVGLISLGEPMVIGITQIVDHPALNATRDGVIDAIREAGYTEDEVKFIFGNAQGDFSIAMSIAQNFLAQGVDLVVAIATPTAQAAVQVFQGTGIPVVFSAVTDPTGAGLIGYENVTGTSDLIDVRADLALLKELSPSIRQVGMVYNPGEANSAILTKMAIEAAPELGLKIVTAAAENTAAVPLAAQSLKGRVDALYVTTDNTVVAALEGVVEVANAEKIPFLEGDPSSLERGPLLCTGWDYYSHGLLTGTIVAKILAGTSPSDIPFVCQKDTEFGTREIWLNLDTAALIGFSFPQSVLQKATGVLFGGRRFVAAE